MLASSQGGINIEEVARDDPDSILTEPVDIDAGISEEQARKVAVFMGFEGDKVDQVTTLLFIIAFDVFRLSLNATQKLPLMWLISLMSSIATLHISKILYLNNYYI